MKRTIGWLLFSLTILSIGASYYLTARYDLMRPTKPQPQYGLIYRVYTSRGRSIYVTKDEATLNNWLECIPYICITLTLSYNLLFDPFGLRRKAEYSRT